MLLVPVVLPSLGFVVMLVFFHVASAAFYLFHVMMKVGSLFSKAEILTVLENMIEELPKS